MPEIRTTFIDVILFVVVASALFLFITTFQTQNNAPSDGALTSNPSFAGINSSINSFLPNGGNAKYSNISSDINATMQSPSIISFGWVIWNGVIGFGQLTIGLPIGLYQMFSGVVAQYLGIPTIYLNAIGIAVTVSLLILLYRFWRQGQ